MKILLINEVFGHTSTGKICMQLAEQFLSDGHEVRIAYGRDDYMPQKFQQYAVRIGNSLDVYSAAIQSRLVDNHGLANKKATKKFLKWADDYKPDLIWLHNLHGYYVNYELLFNWIKKQETIEVKWTLHDCWAFTGHCAYFSYVNCNKWKQECRKCPQRVKYPKSILKDASKDNFRRKKEAFTKVSNLHIIVPSFWLKGLVEESFLRAYPVEVVRNTIDTTVFKPTKSDFREEYGLQNKIILLGVANVWDERKGFQDFIKLAELLEEDYQIVLVGVTKKQRKMLPHNILGFEKVVNQKVLAGIYTAADYFLNLSYEETFGMTTLEAVACGCLSIVYKVTACEEVVKIYGGTVIEPGDILQLRDTIEQYVNNK